MATIYDILPLINNSIKTVTWPTVVTGSTAAFVALMCDLETSQWLPLDVVRQRQLGQLAVLAAHSEKHSPYFRRRLEQAGLRPQDIASPEGFKRLPLLTRRDIQQAGQDLYCDAVPRAHWPVREYKTSGSTGEPIAVRKTELTSFFWYAHTMREHLWNDRDFSGRVMVIESTDSNRYLNYPGWGPPFHLLFPTGAVRCIPIVSDIKDQIREIQEFRPMHLLVYPSNLGAIIAQCEKENIVIEGVKHIWSQAETLKPELRKKAAAFFGASIEDNYSSMEIGIMTVQCPVSGLHHEASENILLEVLDDDGEPCAEGEIGRVVVTDLHNFATPMIRYATGDFAEAGGLCPCGRKSPTLKAIQGRERNLIVKPGGIRHWPQIDFAEFEDIHLIHQHQLIQHSVEEIEIRLVAKTKLTEMQETALTAHLHNTMDYPFRFRFTYFDGHLPFAKNGKFEEFICLIKAQ